MWANVGGAIGAILFSVLTQRIGLKPARDHGGPSSAAMVAAFGQGQPDLSHTPLLAGIGGFFCNAAIVGLYAMFAQSFPTAIRASGTGFVIGVGRGGRRSGRSPPASCSHEARVCRPWPF